MTFLLHSVVRTALSNCVLSVPGISEPPAADYYLPITASATRSFSTAYLQH